MTNLKKYKNYRMEPKVSYLPVHWKDMREADWDIPAHLFGSETHVTAVVGMALDKWLIPENTGIIDS